jgi:hypothetical protein
MRSWWAAAARALPGASRRIVGQSVPRGLAAVCRLLLPADHGCRYVHGHGVPGAPVLWQASGLIGQRHPRWSVASHRSGRRPAGVPCGTAPEGLAGSARVPSSQGGGPDHRRGCGTARSEPGGLALGTIPGALPGASACSRVRNGFVSMVELIKMTAVIPAGARRWALIAVAACVLVVGLDLTVLNLALPVLARDLDASTGDLQWFASAYSLVLAAALLPAGLLGDRFGRKKVLLAALTLFGASSAACAYAGSSGALTRPGRSWGSAPPQSCRCRCRSCRCSSPRPSGRGQSR